MCPLTDPQKFEFNAQEAPEHGLIDQILRPARVKADASRYRAWLSLYVSVACAAAAS